MAGQQVGIFKVSSGLGEIEGRDRDTEIEGRDRDTEIQRDREIERQRNKADNKNPQQSRVAQLVKDKQKTLLVGAGIGVSAAVVR
jgi:uncharacterized protein YaiL (DUF2058 family)